MCRDTLSHIIFSSWAGHLLASRLIISTSCIPAMADAAMTDVPADIDGLAKLCVLTGAAGQVQQLLESCEAHGIVYTQKVNCQQILVAKCNRGGDGVDFADVQENVSDIASIKFHQTLFKGLISDIPAPEYDDIVEFNTNMVNCSNGLLAPVEARKATHMSLWGGHTTQGFRCVRAGCPHWDSSLCVDDKLSIERVSQVCPRYADAIQHGAEYKVLPSWFLRKYPGLDDAVQAAGNVIQNVSKSENDLQMLRKLMTKIKAGQPFEEIKMAFKKTRPKNIGALPHMFNFLRKFPDELLLNNMITFCKNQTSGSQTRTIDGAVFDALQIDWKGFLQAPHIRYGILTALYADKKTGLFLAPHIKAVGAENNIRATISAEEDVKTMKYMIKDSLQADSDTTKAWLNWSQFLANTACMIMKKNTTDVEHMLEVANQKKDYLVHIGHLQCRCVNAINEAYGVKLTKEFDAHVIPVKITATQQAPGKAPSSRLAEDLTESLMSELGFMVGSTIQASKKPKTGAHTMYTIESMANGIIKVIDTALKKPAPGVPIKEFQDKAWKIVVSKDSNGGTITYNEEHSQHAVTSIIQNVIKAQCTLKLYEAWDSETLESGYVDVVVGHKGVVAKKDFKTNELVLAPNSHNVSVRELKHNEKLPDMFAGTGVLLGTAKINGKTYVVTATSMSMHVKCDKSRVTKDTCIVPYWQVDTTDKDDQANMKLSENLSSFKIDIESYNVKVPLMRNTKQIKAGDRLVLLCAKSDKNAEQPALKKQKTGNIDA